MQRLTRVLVGLALMLPLPALASGGVSLPVGGERVVDFGTAVATFYIQNPEVVDARALDEHRVELTGLKAGASPVIAYDATGARVYVRDVRVGVIRRGPSYTQVIIHNGSQRTSYACTEELCRAPGARP